MRLSKIMDPLERGNYIESVAREYHIDASDLKETVTRYGIAGANRIDTSVFRERRERKSPEEEKAQKQLKTERLLLTWLINENTLFEALQGKLSPDDFFEPVYHDIAAELFAQYEKEGKVTPAAIINHYQSKEEHEQVSKIMQQDFDMEITQSEKSKVITDLVKGVKLRSVQHQLELSKGDLAKTGQLLIEKAKIENIAIILK